MIGDDQLAQIAWPDEGGTILAAGLGGIEPDTLVAIARDMAGLDTIDAIAVPAGLSEIEVPRPVSSVHYDTTEVALTVEQVDGPLDLQAIAMIRLGAWAMPLAVPELGGYELGDGSGWQNLLIPIDDHSFATVTGPPGTDAKAMAATIHEVPTGEVAPQPVPKVGQGGDVPPRFGEISLGRFAAYEYTSDDGSECVTFVSLNLFASPSCLPADRAQCPRFSTFDEGTIVVVLPYETNSVALEVAGSGEAVPVTIEHALGYTFATGPSPGVVSPHDVFVDGEPVCPSG